MASSAAYDTLVGHLRDNWNTTVIVEENSFDKLDAGTPWLYVECWSDDDDQESIGAGEPTENMWREFGWLRITVLVKAGSGGAHARTLRDQLVDLFRGLRLDDIVLRTIHRAGGETWDGAPRGNWYGLPLIIDWYREY